MTTTALPDDRPDVDVLAATIRGLPSDAGFSGLTAGRVHGLWLPPSAAVAPTEFGVPGRDGPARLRTTPASTGCVTGDGCCVPTN